MSEAGEWGCAYARACGIISKSFIGKRISALADLRTIADFERLVFPDIRRDAQHSVPTMPPDLETRIMFRAVTHILAVVRLYQEPPELLVRLLRSYEYADLKTCLHYIADGKKTAPSVAAIGRFGTVKFDCFPDLDRMLAGTEFKFMLGEKNKGGAFDLVALEIELDLRYYRSLALSLQELDDDDHDSALPLLCEEISLRNCIWALRLRSYYNESPAETGRRLMNVAIPNSGGKRDSLSRDARESLDMPLDSRSAWKGWKWEKFLNPEKHGEAWKVDPRHFQNAASQHLYQLALRSFRKTPFAVGSVYCYIKLKQFEEDFLTSVAEGLTLGMPLDSSSADIFALLEAAS